jgi:hypothetical protein
MTKSSCTPPSYCLPSTEELIALAEDHVGHSISASASPVNNHFVSSSSMLSLREYAIDSPQVGSQGQKANVKSLLLAPNAPIAIDRTARWTRSSCTAHLATSRPRPETTTWSTTHPFVLTNGHLSPLMRWTQRMQIPCCCALLASSLRPLMVRCWPPSWEPQEEGMMSTAASFPQYKTKVYRTSRRKNQLPKVEANWLGDSSRKFIYGALSRV